MSCNNGLKPQRQSFVSDVNIDFWSKSSCEIAPNGWGEHGTKGVALLFCEGGWRHFLDLENYLKRALEYLQVVTSKELDSHSLLGLEPLLVSFAT